MSLLDDVSIVVTPNGYKAGELYAVVPVPTEGAEEVTYPNFTNSDISQWTMSSGRASKSWDAAEFMRLDFSIGNGAALYAVFGQTLNARYKVTMRVRGTKADGVTAQGSTFGSIGDSSEQGEVISNPNLTAEWQDYEFYVVSTNTVFRFYLFSAAIGDLVDFDSISVKEYTSADMDVTRATAATRVDENGLVNYAEVIGGELVTNGSFTTDTDWTKGAGWTISGGSASHTGGASYLSQDVLQVDTLYKVNISVTAVSGGGFVQIYMGNSPASVLISQIGDYTYYFTSQSSVLLGLALRSLGDVTIDNVSVKEVTRDNVPRIDYTGGGCPHILAEPQRTNELTQSNQFDTTWVQSGTLTSGQDGVGGSTDAWKFENPNATSSLYQTDTTSGVQTVSAYFKKNSNYGVRFFAFGSVNCSTYFDLNNGAVVSVINSTAKVEHAGADWFRCSMTFDQTTSRCDFYVTNNASTQVLGDYTIQYAQLESGSYATSYIPTSGSTVTRNQDIFTRDGIGSLINSTEGVLFVEIAFSDGGRLAILNSDASDDQVVLGFSGSVFCRIRENGANVVTQFVGSANQLNTYYKIAVKYKSGSSAIWVDGNETVFAGTFTLNDLSKILFISEGSRTYGKVKQLQVYDTALTDTQLAALTS